jgi:hypothetical protein
MRARSITAFAVGIVLLGGATTWAQSLADIAKKEEERRKTVKEPTKVYTNKDLRPVPPPAPPPATETAAESSDKATEAKEPSSDKDKKDEKAKDEGPAAGSTKNPEYWRKRVADLQAQLERDQTYLDAVQSRINALTTEFVNRDDPAQRAVIERERNRNLAELDRLRKAVETDRKAIADFQEEARRAGVPPGWLR